MEKLNDPLNSEERFLHAIATRLDVVIEQSNSIIEHLASKDKVAVTENKVETKKAEPKKRVAKKKE